MKLTHINLMIIGVKPYKNLLVTISNRLKDGAKELTKQSNKINDLC